MTCPNTIAGQIDSPGDPKQTGRVNQGVPATVCSADPVPAPAVIPGQFGYDKYTFKNRSAGNPQCMTITLRATAGTNGLSAATYQDAFDPTNIVTNFIGSTGNPSRFGDAQPQVFRVNVPALKDFVVVVNEFVDGGGGAYQLTVEGCGRILISSITPAFGPTAGGTVVTINGAGFHNDSTVTFGGVLGTNFVYTDEFTIQVTTPPYTGGGASPHAVDVAVSNGTGAPEVKAGGFTYYDRAATSLTLSTPGPTVYGQAPVITAAITPPANPNAPSGVVNFFEGNPTPIGVRAIGADAKALLIVGGLSVGVHTYTASYAGDAFYNPADAPAYDHTVNKSPTTTTLTSSENPVAPGDTVTYSAVVRGPFALNTTGLVTFNEDGVDLAPVELVNGVATIPRSYPTTAGSPHIIKASYAGDGNFLPSVQVAQISQGVAAAAPNMNITAAPETVSWGTNVVFTANVPTRSGVAAPTGTVVFTVDTGAASAPIVLTDGKASLPAQSLNAGPHTIKATFTSTSVDYLSGDATLTFTVARAATATKVESSKLAANLNDTLTFTATVSSEVKVGTIVGTVQFMDGTTKLGSPVTIGSGVAKLEGVKNLIAGTHRITAVFTGDTTGNFADSTSPAIDQVVGTSPGGDAGPDSGKDAGPDSSVRPDGGGGFDSGTGGGGNASTEGGGCDCNTTGGSGSGFMALLGGLGFALMLVRRRRNS